MSVLLFILLLPIAAATAILLGAPGRRTALAASAGTLALTLAALFRYDTRLGGFQLHSSVPVLAGWDLNFHLGADGLSLLMLLLTAVVTLAAVWVSPPPAGRGERPYFACVLLIAAGAIGAFASLDLFFFYAFHELALIPTFLLIGIWGHGERQSAAWKITIYLALGSFLLLIGLIGLYQSVPLAERTFDIPKLQTLAAAGRMHPASQNAIYLCLLLGFGILISLFPFHTWAPQAYASAPTPAAMLHAGVLKKFGLYGLLRVALPMLPEAARHWTNLLLILLVGNIIYVGLATIAQKRLDTMLGYSSVMHMGYIFLGIASLNSIGLNGAALMMFAHGLSIAALFAVAGQLRERTGTLAFADLGGIAQRMPRLGLIFGMAAFAAIGLPGFANFASEALVFFGAFRGGTAWPFSPIQIATTFALWGVVISAVYMLRAYRAVFLGEMHKRWAALHDIGAARWPLALLLAVLLLAGFRPQMFLSLIAPGIKAIIALR